VSQAAHATALCEFCLEQPEGASGHPGLAQQAHTLNGARSYARLACAFCGTSWVRHRENAKSFEWLRLAD
jgi:hypothetical protein